MVSRPPVRSLPRNLRLLELRSCRVVDIGTQTRGHRCCSFSRLPAQRHSVRPGLLWRSVLAKVEFGLTIERRARREWGPGTGFAGFFKPLPPIPASSSLQYLEPLHNRRWHLAPSQLLNVNPPFCVKESSNGASLRATTALSQIRFLADFARPIAGRADGDEIRLVVSRP